MEGVAHAMTCQVTHDAIAVLLAMLLDGMANVTHKTERLRSLHAYLQALLGHPDKLLLLGRRLTYYKHTRGIGIIAVDDGCEVHVDDVTLLEHILLLGYAMTHHLIDARAYRHGEWRCLVVSAIVQTSRYSIVLLAIAAAYLVNLQRRHACPYMLGHLVEYPRIDDTCPADALNLFGCLNQVAGRHQLTLLLPVHHLPIQLCRLLPRQAVPSSLLCHNIHNSGAKVVNNYEL